MIKIKIKDITICALFTALLCALSLLSFPIGVIPISFSLLGILVTALTLEPKKAILTVAAFLLLGICGLPVFAGGNAGLAALFFPTGGFILAYLPLAAAISMLKPLRQGTVPCVGILMLLLMPFYAVGNAYYCLIVGTKFFPSLLVTTLPFIPFDILKCFAAVVISKKLKPILLKI